LLYLPCICSAVSLSVLAAAARALTLHLRSPTSSARRRAPPLPLHCSTSHLPRRAASAIDASGRRLAERRKPVSPSSPPRRWPRPFAGGRTLTPPHAGSSALLLLPCRRPQAKDQDRVKGFHWGSFIVLVLLFCKMPLLGQIEESLEELAPACTLELLSLPQIPENSECKRGAIAALCELLRQGLDVESSCRVHDWSCFLGQAIWMFCNAENITNL
ncbi:unnamed protein product, partial [Urochloa humidicola]